MAKKLFISQPMRDKTKEFIKEEREKMIATVKEKYGDDIEIIDSYFPNYNGNAVGFLSKAIEKLSEADMAVFASGWDQARGCKIEHTICTEYGIPIAID